MTKKTDIFRLRRFFSPSYIAGRLSEINSISDAFVRAGKAMIYMGCFGRNVYYKTRGFFIIAWSKSESFYYTVRGWCILGNKKISDAAGYIPKALIYGGYGCENIYYKARGIFIIIWRRAGGLLCGFSDKIFQENGKQSGAAAKFFRAVRLREILLKLEREFQFFGDIYRDFCLRMGLYRLKPIKDVRMRRMMPANPFHQSDNLLRVHWLIHPFCDYKCSYCSQHGAISMIDGDDRYVKRSKEEYIQGWERFNQKYGPAKIEIMGGEPFLTPDMPDILSAISVKNTVSVITNLSWDPKLIIGRADPEKLSFLVSYHPEYEPFVDRFIDKITVLQRAGFFTVACIVVWPPFISKLPSLLKKFYFRGISVLIEPFVGEWKGRVYPRSYTAFERESIKILNNGKYILPYAYDSGSFNRYEDLKWGKDTTEIDLAISFQFSNSSPKGKLCNAGRSYFRLLYSGDVRRCGHGERLGEFFSGDFNLLDKPKSCPFDKCDCIGENLCLEESMEGSKQLKTGDRV